MSLTPFQSHYNGWIVLLSILISICASYSALNIAGKIYRTRGRSRWVWLLAASSVMGLGIWSMHFIGMLAFHFGSPVTYNTGITVLSLLVSIGGSLIAFYIASNPDADTRKLLLGGLCMAIGVVLMHYMGMAAMRMDGTLTYNRSLQGLSTLIALMASNASLLLFRRFRHIPNFSRWKIYSAVLMGVAVSGMHYTGMLAVQIHHKEPWVRVEEHDYGGFLLLAVAVATFIILAVSMMALFFDRHVLEKMAYQDALTGLPNRYGLVRDMDNHRSNSWHGAVLFMDLDRFKMVNDTLGHDVGDLLLQEVAERFVQSAGSSSPMYRLGGDEFVCILPKGSRTSAAAFAQKLLDLVQQPIYIEEHELYITASIGISLSPEHGTDRMSLIKASDAAMYYVKSSGKNGYKFYDDYMMKKQTRRFRLEKDLQNALAHHELEVVYQPKWDISSNQLSGMEALLRWKHPELGPVSPVEFIPIAEENGSILTITRWVLFSVCRQNLLWQEAGLATVPISVNISSQVLESGMLETMVDEALLVSGLSPRYLELEITESTAMMDMEGMIEQIKRIRSKGISFSLDDFGTGYSSLGRLGALPVDTLKIDRIFIDKSNMLDKQSIINHIIAIAKNLNLNIVAEGIERREQMEFLKSCGCYVMQGYYFGKPMGVDALGHWLLAGGASAHTPVASSAEKDLS